MMTDGSKLQDDSAGSFRERYFEALGFPSTDKRCCAALQRAHELRALEIDLYWKRATYVWAFQGAAFAALAFTLSREDVREQVVLVVCAFGAITALAALLTARGSKFWQENWESHVELLEKHDEGRLMQTVIVQSEVRHSVSRVNERLIGFLHIGWTLTFFLTFAALVAPGFIGFTPTLEAWLIGGGFSFGILHVSYGTRSRLRGSAWRRGAPNWRPRESGGSHDPWLIWRGHDPVRDGE